ncbi:hypothetical protein MMC12_007625 [Toensbergia leucococca]|nr:hypothetical protein [Toensbergia leucococca]
MPPKPFPFPIGVGVDICRVARVRKIIEDDLKVNRWARKFFTRLEWPRLLREFQKIKTEPFEQAPNEHGSSTSGLSELLKQAPNELGSSKNEIFPMTPYPSSPTAAVDSEKKLRSFSSKARPTLIPLKLSGPGKVLDTRLNGLANWVAGRYDTDCVLYLVGFCGLDLLLTFTMRKRWAAKEAIIKAHCHRRLFFHDISIISGSPDPSGSKDRKQKTNKMKPYALIDPPSRTVMMSQATACKRMIREESYRTEANSVFYREIVKGRFTEDQCASVIGDDREDKIFIKRRMLVKEDDRQIAEINISHDGDYAVAVCMALDEEVEDQDDDIWTVDDGTGDPNHEPEWGDEGFLTSGFKQLSSLKESHGHSGRL